MSAIKDIFSDEELIESEMFQIIKMLLDEKQIELKTEIGKPLQWSIFSSLLEYLKSKKLSNSSKMLEIFRHNAFKYYLSYKRKSREEIVRSLTNLKEELRNTQSEDIQQPPIV